MSVIKTKGYCGEGPEIVWVGLGSEVCALGTEEDKYFFLKHGRFDVLSLGMRMGFLEPVFDSDGNPKGVLERASLDSEGFLKPLEDQLPSREISLGDEQNLRKLEDKWHDFIYNHTGVRSITAKDKDWDPKNFPFFRNLSMNLPENLIHLLELLGFNLERGKEILDETSNQEWGKIVHSLGLDPKTFSAYESDKTFQVIFHNAGKGNFPFKVDFGAPLPTGWFNTKNGFLGLTRKEVNGLNQALMIAHEIVYRALLNACLHPSQKNILEIFSPEEIGLYIGSGIGPHEELENMVLDTLKGKLCGAKSLINSIVNIANGYISARLGLKGKISAHVGACETCLGSIADAYWDLKAGRFSCAIAGGFEDAVTASSYNGFSSNMAFTTNEKVLHNILLMIEEGALKDAQIEATIKARFDQAQTIDSQLKELESEFKNNQIPYPIYLQKKFNLKDKKRNTFMNLPKNIAAFSSMPFSKYRSGFVMGVGGGAGVFMTLEKALALGLPIRGYLAGVAEMVPDSGQAGAASIAALGDGVGEAYGRAFYQAQKNYQVLEEKDKPLRPLKIDDIGVWFAHGTSTPLNGYGERREIERVHKKLGRSAENPICITGDKAESGHRVAGNFPALVGYIFENNEILPVGNYLQAGFEPKGRRGFGESLDKIFPSTKIVGQGGLGEGKPVPYTGDYVAVNGAGFGRINSVLIFRRFRLEGVEISSQACQDYQDQLAKNIKDRKWLAQKILFGTEALIR